MGIVALVGSHWRLSVHMVGAVLKTEAHAHSGRGADSSLSLGLTWACLDPSTVVSSPSCGLANPTPLLDPAPNPRENPNRVEAPLPCTGKETEA